MNPVKLRNRAGWKKGFNFLQSLARLPTTHLLWPPHTLSPLPSPSSRNTPSEGPWGLASARPIRYQEQKGRKNCFLSTPCPGLTRDSVVVNTYLYVNGLMEFWQFCHLLHTWKVCVTSYLKSNSSCYWVSSYRSGIRRAFL